MGRILETIKPDPDSQYRLCPCRCGSHNVAYVKCVELDDELWVVRCFDCGEIAAAGPLATRHDVQLIWNNWAKEETCKATIF